MAIPPRFGGECSRVQISLLRPLLVGNVYSELRMLQNGADAMVAPLTCNELVFGSNPTRSTPMPD